MGDGTDKRVVPTGVHLMPDPAARGLYPMVDSFELCGGLHLPTVGTTPSMASLLLAHAVGGLAVGGQEGCSSEAFGLYA